MKRERYNSWFETVLSDYLERGEASGIDVRLLLLPLALGAIAIFVVTPLLVLYCFDLSKTARLVTFVIIIYIVMPIILFVLLARAHLRKMMRDEAERTKPKVEEP